MTTLVLTDPVNGTVADANTIASNNTATKAVVNGNIDNANMAAAAAVAVTKLATGGPGQVLGTLAGVNTWLGGLGQIADSTAGGSVASFDFTSLPTTYAHLLVMLYLRGDQAAVTTGCTVRYNNDSGTNYDNQLLTANSTTLTGLGQNGQTSGRIGQVPGANAPANAFGTGFAFIGHYTNATNHKSGICYTTARQGTGAVTDITAELSSHAWFAAAAAITRITILPGSGNFVTGSRATVYGIG